MKSVWVICVSLGWVRGRGRRVRVVIEVIEGLVRHSVRTPPPIRPVAPVRIIFIVRRVLLFGGVGWGGRPRSAGIVAGV